MTSLPDVSSIESPAFTKHLGLFASPKGSHLLNRTRALGEWLDLRAELNTWPYARTLHAKPGTTTELSSQNSRRVHGLNFGSQDTSASPRSLRCASTGRMPLRSGHRVCSRRTA